MLTILDALRDPKLFGPFFEPPVTWTAWRAFLAALFGLPMTTEQLEIYRRHTGRSTTPLGRSREGWVIAGRRSGKSYIAALIGTFVAFFWNYEFLSVGERALVLLIAPTRRQVRILFTYICGYVDAVPMLANMVERRTAEALHLNNGVILEVAAASHVSVRGYTCACVVILTFNKNRELWWRRRESNPAPFGVAIGNCWGFLQGHVAVTWRWAS